MSLLDRLNLILTRAGLSKPTLPEPPAEPIERVPGTFDGIVCPECECPDWKQNGRERSYKTSVRHHDGSRRKILKRAVPLQCEACRHKWRERIIEAIR